LDNAEKNLQRTCQNVARLLSAQQPNLSWA
jgi:hypothetical protein